MGCGLFRSNFGKSLRIMSRKGLKHLPVYRKAVELQMMSRAIALCLNSRVEAGSLYRSNSLRDQIAGSLLIDTALIRKQIALAAGTPSFDARQKSLQFINVMSRNLHTYCRGLEMDGMREREYLELLRSELQGFRKSFKNWRRSLME